MWSNICSAVEISGNLALSVEYYFKVYLKGHILQVIAHELGHNLGMPDEYIWSLTPPGFILRDSKGVSCTSDNGVMDSKLFPKKWTTCSVEMFTCYYNHILNTHGHFCMELGGNGTTTG
jgi:hypothetical protein